MRNLYPADWRIVTLGDITTLSQYGINSPSGEGSTYPMLRMNNIQSGSLDTKNLMYVELGSDEFEKFRLYPDDILINRTNSLELVGKSSIFRLSGDFVFASYLVRFRLIDEALPLYIHYYLNSEMGQQTLTSLATKGVSQANINPTTLKKRFVIPLPPLPEQRAIAAILSTWDEALTLTKRLIDALKRRKAALMQLLLTGEVRFSEFDGAWEIVELTDLGKTYAGLSGKSANDFGKGKRYIPYMNIFSNSVINPDWTQLVQVSEHERQNQVQYGDIFFTTSSETPDEVGMSAVLLNAVQDVYLNSFCFGFRLHNFEKLLPEYARFLFRSKEFRQQIFALAQGSTRYNLSKRELMKMIVELPNKNEQIKNADVLSHAEIMIDSLVQHRGHLITQKRGLMQQLLTGAIRVQGGEVAE